MQAQVEAFSVPLDEDWLDQRDAGALAQALKSLITELIGWGEPTEDTSLLVNH